MFACLYPYCFLKATKKGCFIKNTLNGQFVISKSNSIYKYFTASNTLSYEVDLTDDELKNFIDEAVTKDCCYLIDSSTQPISPTININLISSIKKDFATLRIKNYGLMFSLVKQVNIHFANNTISFTNKAAYKILDYPEDNLVIKSDSLLFEEYDMPNLGTIIVSGDVPLLTIDNLCIKYSSKKIIVKVSINYLLSHISLLEVVRKFTNTRLQIIIEELYDIDGIPPLNMDHIDILAPITNIKNIDHFLKLSNKTIFYPLITAENRDVMLSEISLTFEDIITSKISIDEIHRRQVVNTNIYGSLTVKNNGDVCCMSDKIGNYLQDDIKESLYEYLLSDNYWYLTRNFKEECKNCLFTEICPPITIYESEEIIDCMCAKLI